MSRFKFGNETPETYTIDMSGDQNGSRKSTFELDIDGTDFGAVKSIHLGNLGSMGLDNFGAGGFLSATTRKGDEIQMLIDEAIEGDGGFTLDGVDFVDGEYAVTIKVQGSSKNKDVAEDTIVIKGLSFDEAKKAIIADDDPNEKDVLGQLKVDGVDKIEFLVEKGEPGYFMRQSIDDEVVAIDYIDDQMLLGNSPLGNGIGDLVARPNNKEVGGFLQEMSRNGATEVSNLANDEFDGSEHTIAGIAVEFDFI